MADKSDQQVKDHTIDAVENNLIDQILSVSETHEDKIKNLQDFLATKRNERTAISEKVQKAGGAPFKIDESKFLQKKPSNYKGTNEEWEIDKLKGDIKDEYSFIRQEQKRFKALEKPEVQKDTKQIPEKNPQKDESIFKKFSKAISYTFLKLGESFKTLGEMFSGKKKQETTIKSSTFETPPPTYSLENIGVKRKINHTKNQTQEPDTSKLTDEELLRLRREEFHQAFGETPYNPKAYNYDAVDLEHNKIDPMSRSEDEMLGKNDVTEKNIEDLHTPNINELQKFKKVLNKYNYNNEEELTETSSISTDSTVDYNQRDDKQSSKPKLSDIINRNKSKGLSK